MCFFKIGDRHEAINAFQNAIKLSEQRTDLNYSISLAYYELNEFDSAIVNLKETTKIDPKFVAGYSLLGQTYIKKGDYENAAIAFGVVTQLEPKNAESFYNVGVAYYNLVEYENANSCLEYAIQLSPRARDFHYLLALVFIHLNRNDDAIMHLLSANEIREDYDTYFNLVSYQANNIGYNLFNLILASAVENCQSTFVFWKLR